MPSVVRREWIVHTLFAFDGMRVSLVLRWSRGLRRQLRWYAVRAIVRVRDWYACLVCHVCADGMRVSLQLSITPCYIVSVRQDCPRSR